MPLGTYVSAGELSARISIIRPVGTTSATGGIVEGSPETFADLIPAAIASALGNESIQAGGLAAFATHRIRVRYLPGLKPWMWVTFEGREFQILSIVDVNERHIEQELLCAER